MVFDKNTIQEGEQAIQQLKTNKQMSNSPEVPKIKILFKSTTAKNEPSMSQIVIARDYTYLPYKQDKKTSDTEDQKEDKLKEEMKNKTRQDLSSSSDLEL